MSFYERKIESLGTIYTLDFEVMTAAWGNKEGRQSCEMEAVDGALYYRLHSHTPWNCLHEKFQEVYCEYIAELLEKELLGSDE